MQGIALHFNTTHCKPRSGRNNDLRGSVGVVMIQTGRCPVVKYERPTASLLTLLSIPGVRWPSVLVPDYNSVIISIAIPYNVVIIRIKNSLSVNEKIVMILICRQPETASPFVSLPYQEIIDRRD